MDQGEQEKLRELDVEIEKCRNLIYTIKNCRNPLLPNILESYQTLNNQFKNVFIKSIKLSEQVLIPKQPQLIDQLSCTVELQTTLFNNEVQQNFNQINLEQVIEKQDRLKNLYLKAKEHSYLKEQKRTRK